MLSQLTKIVKKRIDSRLLTISVLVFSLGLCNTVLAEYRPPSDQKPPTTRTTGTVTRGGCRGDKQTTLTALAPQKHTGQTVSSHPTFAWFVPDAESYPLEFRLYRYEASGNRALMQKIQLQSQSGIMSFSLPPDTPPLGTGQRYHWQVVLFCNPNRPSSALATGADLDVVAIPHDLASKLATTNNPQQRVNLYASAGLWYDALSTALTDTMQQRLELELLEDLAKLEDTNTTVNTVEYSSRIRPIIELER
ncbi:DUF928 domain-containing protein [Gloeocapsopsis dulcis]|uniref:DUF928 domain-containing protein n=1 Tax=Gloeocapsopsis dulcis AAB1 = 1H9 TaxID=1433147 RepID=A0A6N8FRU8_9CHRO|nr:DUF928 domain-containing protein [Gloeocapsopsis dulcis]MUL34927.1 hypothetical protein [Gloeocapsopsis dulcis AAB1 = 1H9]WNN90001.1 DUF928 domain-containing protein [Gloeocapsopsis dulcis]